MESAHYYVILTFYTGKIAESVARCVREHGGVMTEEDLASHVSKGSAPQTHVEPISVEYEGVTVHEIPPNGQGLDSVEQK